jgi:hypothetical protein
MEIFVGGNKVTLTQKNFVAKGGEGQIFHKDKIAYKIYEDLSKMIPPAKIGELESLDNPCIVRPKELIINGKKQPVGFTMDWVGGKNHPLCKLFTSKFQRDNGIVLDQIIALVERIKKVTHYIHDHKCLVVDGNELNYLVKQDFITPLFIDVNSWQTPSFPATAIMPSIRDWTTDEFTQLTDWFSFAVVSFQLFVGVHPYKGKHPNYRKNDFTNRIRDGVSVFNPQVSLPPTTRDFSLIPSAYKDWYYQLFENRDRKLPPMLPGEAGVVQVTVQIITGTDAFEVTMIKDFGDEILFHNPEFDITKTTSKIFIGKTDYRVSPNVEMLFVSAKQIPLLIKIEDGVAKFKCLKSGYTIKGAALACSEMMIVDNTLFLKNGMKLIEMDFKEMSQNIIPLPKTTWTVEPLASQIFGNVIYQSVLGKAFLCIPQPVPGNKSKFHIVRVPEIDNHRVIEARYENQICCLITHTGREYERVIIIFDKSFQKYTLRTIQGIDYTPLNFAVLDNGVCVMIPEDNVIEIFLNRMDKQEVKRIEDPKIDSSMRLLKDGTRIKFFKDNCLYSMTMKK